MGQWQHDEMFPPLRISQSTQSALLISLTNLAGDKQDTDHPPGQWENSETSQVKFLTMYPMLCNLKGFDDTSKEIITII